MEGETFVKKKYLFSHIQNDISIGYCAQKNARFMGVFHT
jgi:hypothetical protein